MNKFTTILAAAAGILLAGCSQPSGDTLLIDSWPVEETLDDTRIDLPLNEHLTNMGAYAGDYLVFNAFKADYCFLVYDRDFNLVDTVVRKGMGPEEMPMAMFYGQWKGSASSPELILFSEPLNRIASLSLNPVSGPVKIADIPTSSYLSPSSIYQVSDTLFAGVSLEMPDGAQLFQFNPATGQSRRYPLPFEFTGNDKFYTTQQSMAYNAGRGQYCTAYSSVPWIVIYDSDFNVVRKIAIGEEVNTQGVSTGAGYAEMSMVRYHGNHIMVMYWANPSESDDCRLLVLDADGNPEGSFGIGDAIGYLVDTRSNRLLTVHHDKEEDVVYLKSSPLPALLTK